MTAAENESAAVQPVQALTADAKDDEGARLLAELGAVQDAPAQDMTPIDADAEDAAYTPRAFIEYALSLRGHTLDEAKLPSTLIATFQPSVYRDLVAATGAEQAPQTPVEVMAVAQGKIGERPVALRRLSIGAPAAVTTLEEMIALGVRDILIIGTGGSLQPALPVGSLIVPTSAIREDGVSFHYAPAGSELAPDETLAQALAEAVVAQGSVVTYGPVWTIDAPYRETRAKVAAYGAMGVLAAEMEAAALFALAKFRGIRLALLLAISDEIFHEWRPGFHSEELRAAKQLMIQAALQVAANLKDTTAE